MICNVGAVVRLCWILCLLLPFVHCQPGGRFGSPSNPFTTGFGPAGGSFHRGGFPGRPGTGGNFHGGFGQGIQPPLNPQFTNDEPEGRPGEQQQGGASTPPGQEGQQSPVDSMSASEAALSMSAPPSSSAPVTVLAEPSIAPAAINTNGDMAMDQAETMPSNFVASASTFIEGDPPQPSSIVNVFGDAATSSFQAALPAVVPSSSVNNVATSSVAFEQFPTPVSATSTFTTSMTVYVTASPVPASDAAPSPTLDLAPLSTSTGTTMSASAQAGMGIGIAFGLLSIAGMTGLYLWRRHRNQRFDRDINLTPTSRGPRPYLAGFFRKHAPRFNNNKKTDTEWSIESASKVEIVRGASATSVRTGSSQSISRGAEIQHPPHAGGGATEVVKVGMRVPNRTLPPRPPNPALTSNPPISPSQFPTPPSSRGSVVVRKAVGEGKEGKTGSWPLPD